MQIYIILLGQDELKIIHLPYYPTFTKYILPTCNVTNLKLLSLFAASSSSLESADRKVMEHADRDNDCNGWVQAEAETLRGSISPIWLIPFSFSSLLIPQDNNRWLWANNTANLSALHANLSCTNPSSQATVAHINILLRTAQGQSHKYHIYSHLTG